MDQQRCDERHERIDARLNSIEASVKDFSEVVIAIKELAIETKYMREDVNKHNDRLERLEAKGIDSSNEDLRRQNAELQKQADKWERFKWLLVAALITLIVGIIATALKL